MDLPGVPSTSPALRRNDKENSTIVLMKKIGFWKIIGVVGLFVFLAILRLHEYDRLPGSTHAEELLYSWSGIHLIETGVPQSWSTLDYPKENLVFDGIVGKGNTLSLPAKLYRPWLDEPPLYSLMSGGVAHWYGDDRNLVIPTSHSRVPSVIASVISLALVFWVGFKFFSLQVGVLAMLFYGVTPTFVFGSRLSVPENILAMVVVGCLLLAKAYLKKPKAFIAVLWGLFSAILGLMKPTGFFLAPLTIFLCLKKRRYLDATVITLFTVLGVVAFVAYGKYFDWELFQNIVRIQGTRFAGWSGLGYIFTSPAFDIYNFYDGWYIFGLGASLIYTLKKVKSPSLNLLSLFFVYWLMVAVLSGTEQDLLPWYRYTMFPLMAVFGGLGLRYVIKNANFYTAVMVVGLLLSSRFYLMNAFRPTTPTIVFRLTYGLALLPSLLFMLYKWPWLKTVTQYIVIIFIGLGVFFNSRYIYSAFEVRCESIDCPFGPTTKLSEVRVPFIWRILVPNPDNKDMLTTKRPKF